MSDKDIVRVILALRRAVGWLKRQADELVDTRDTAIALSALVAAERNPHSHIVQRLLATLSTKQAGDGSWSEELWDTVWAARALHDAGYSSTADSLQNALRFIYSIEDVYTGTWYEEPFETLLVLDLLATLTPSAISNYSAAIKWIVSLQRKDGCIVGIRYTGMAVSLFQSLRKIGVAVDPSVISGALSFIRDRIENTPIWTAASWSNYYPLCALLDCGYTWDDPSTARAIEWFLSSQDSEGKWAQVSKIHDTSMSILVLSRLLTTPLVDLPPPKTAALNVLKENGTIRVGFHEAGAGAIAPTERMKLSSNVRDDLSRNQQLIASTFQRPRAAQVTIPRDPSSRSAYAELVRNGRYAYGRLIPGRIKAMLDRSAADHLRLEIDERLIDLPWELIHDGSEFMCLRYAAGRLLMSDQEFQTHEYQAEPASRERVLVVADPTSDLPAAKYEGQRIAALLRDQCQMHVDEFTSSGMNKKDFLLSLAGYDIVHYAGHASHNPDSPDESCLVLADGEIPAFEIGRFIARRSPKIVFLNACWSAEELRDPESYSPMMRGLGRTFLFAGVAAFIGYLIPVPDESATEFAIWVYESVVQGQTMGEAVRQARIRSRLSSGDGDLTWCSAVLYGDPAIRTIVPIEAHLG